MTRREYEIHHNIMMEYRAHKEARKNYEAAIDLLKIINLAAAIAFIISFI